MPRMTHGQRPMTDLEIYNNSPPVVPSKSVWFVNGDLYTVRKRDRANGLVYITNRHNKKASVILWDDFVKRREPAYTLVQVADLLNRHHTWLRRAVWYGKVVQPTYATPDKRQEKFKSAYFSQEQVFEIRAVAAETTSEVKPSGQRGPWVPSVQELTHRMGRGMLMYTKLPDGRFVPIWEETVV